MSELKETVAKNVGVTLDTLNARITEVLVENKSAWTAANKTEDECSILAIRVAGRQLKAEAQRLSRSGAEVLTGMFVSAPRYKDFSKSGYAKMKNTLGTLDEVARTALVAQGRITLIEDNLDGSFTHTVNPTFKLSSLEEETSEIVIHSLPKHVQELDASTWFQIIENNTMPTFQSGDANPRYGRARKLSEPVRECLFLGKRGSADVELITIKFENDLALENQPTFVPGRLPVRMGRNGVGYAKPGVTKFVIDESLATVFAAPPFAVSAEGANGLIVDLVDGVWPQGDFLPSFDLLPEHVTKWADTDQKWDKLCAVHGEVVHIDPREKGGYIVTVGDLDITSTAPSIDVYVPAEHEFRMDFGVGSEIAVVGRAWISRDDECRMDSTAWWVCDSIASAAPAPEEADESTSTGWDA
tara:strand:- start:64 stop:1305 length:1242 start_codon:yes stop_codon:yes gene_type:complete